ncbi:NERD domain-containing protein [Pseudomonas koreensis]|uniref:nuclease-related domain-containing protein n=1 Tax=Pseudomonas koreensis TaxID=198620 RepID=UPI0015773F3D|nr:nuclease-related domain-containing protein [Pseudomonas koreensis]NTZ96895.1 NERD domain-containing protein [Pseudomonas koreensis]
MDLSHIITRAWEAFHWFIPPILLIGLLNSRWGKGHTGELRLRLFARWHLDKQTYRRMHNVTLNTIDGTTQIDHVFISPYGIFVVETKNISGWIFGSEKQSQWTQRLYQKTFKFQNPLRQNYKHLKALEVALGVVTEYLHSVIVFVGASSFKTDMPANVTQGKGFIRYIKSFKQPVFTEAEVDALVQTLRTGRLSPSLATQRAHLQNLKRRNDPTAERKCPKCGSALLIRTVKLGPNAG